jgi:hypothetical protein
VGGGEWNDLSSLHDVDAQIEHAGSVSEGEWRMGLSEWKRFLAAIGLVPAKKTGVLCPIVLLYNLC